MKKKKYFVPVMQVVEIAQTDIICTSTQATFSIQSDTGYEEKDW